MKSNFPGAVPEIPVSDLNRSIAYYKHELSSLERKRGQIYLVPGSKALRFA